MPVVRKRLVIPAFILTVFIYLFFDSIEYEDYPSPPSPPPDLRTDAPTEEPVHWHKIPEHYPVKEFIELPGSDTSHKPIPKIQYDFPKEKSSDRRKRLERQASVKEAFLHAWTGYKTHAWLKDEVSPITGGYVNSFSGWAATLVDTLDTLLIMGLDHEFKLALEAIEQIDFSTTTDKSINVFETTIRYMGGFLAAYDLSEGKYPILLQKAKEVGDFVYGAFDTPNRMQVSRWDWKVSLAGTPMRASSQTLLAEVGSLSLEFTRLTQLTGDPKYYDAIQRVSNNLEKSQSKTTIPGLWPMVVDLENLRFQGSQYTLGGMADSTYEYLPKEHLMLGGSTDQYRRMYEKSIEPIKKNLLFRPMTKDEPDILFSGTRNGGTLEYEAQHLTCFIGGMFGIGAKIFDRPEDLKTAEKLVDGCIWAYDIMATGLMPEIFNMIPCEDLGKCPWDERKWMAAVAKMSHVNAHDEETIRQYIKNAGLAPGMTRVSDSRYILRPEAIESVYILYRITGDKKYQEAAWRMFNSIEKMTRTDFAHASIRDVRFTDSKQVDKMESFWLAETLKYFYLIFSEPGLISLDDYVLNTEAHPLRRPRT
ncbi:class I alpha-mannosidase [Talaromyces stipitatus ATCC 10500]|uniref:alpha-1,2-Mannosidase n=1 Tax=Talaromyces stipitatus (strain ATCC 10500 / CBS 375.48 / QM 6759 / NRRL 1006) TaxID=441959 RepID=B8MKV6_TALSN|nr:class I alpha-mannosidase [Talaromyces stipitatus ATCC 10500]EED14955.1 class I alpha-mannosidase [Talaromyces stipitatus ATCC 10500]